MTSRNLSEVMSIRLLLTFTTRLNSVQGDYLATLTPNAGAQAVAIHQVRRRGPWILDPAYSVPSPSIPHALYSSAPPLTLLASLVSVCLSACRVFQLSKGKTQCPFTRTPGTVQSLSFHPSRPFLFVATQTAVKVYHLIEQRMVKKLMSGCKWISSIDMHPSGDHVIIGSYDRRCASLYPHTTSTLLQ